jgi:hypothetical protein
VTTDAAPIPEAAAALNNGQRKFEPERVASMRRLVGVKYFLCGLSQRVSHYDPAGAARRELGFCRTARRTQGRAGRRGGANPCARAPFCYFSDQTGGSGGIVRSCW